MSAQYMLYNFLDKELNVVVFVNFFSLSHTHTQTHLETNKQNEHTTGRPMKFQR